VTEYPYSVAVVYKEPFGEVAFQAATADEDDGSIAIIYADPEHPRFEETWETFRPGAWREVVVSDVRGNVLFTFTAGTVDDAEPAQARAV
jgi:hypothetical protein